MTPVTEKLCLTSEGRNQCASALHRARVSTNATPKIAQVPGAVAGHRVVFEKSPNVLDRADLRSVGRHILQCDQSTPCFNVRFNQAGAVRLQPIPNDQQLQADRCLQDLQKLDDLPPPPATRRTPACLVCAAAPTLYNCSSMPIRTSSVPIRGSRTARTWKSVTHLVNSQ